MATVNVTDGFVPEPTIHDYLQQVGVPASGDCADVPADVGHYPGFPIGGWSKSWAMWINDGKGGTASAIRIKNAEIAPADDCLTV